MKAETKYKFHIPVLLNEVVTNLNIKKRNWYIDATTGGGGHSQAILELGGNVLAFDQDAEAVAFTRTRLKEYRERGNLRLQEGNFRDIDLLIQKEKIEGIAGILFDLGMSTYQIKEAGRGFSFLKDEPLDMRMSSKTELTAADIINIYPQKELYEIFRKFGEEHLASEVAFAVFRARAIKKIRTTGQLGEIVADIYQKEGIREKIHPATRVFQALRIAVNSELENIKQALPKAFTCLKPQGRLVVISFHSLEDRLVKRYFLERQQRGEARLIVKKPITASETEVKINPASRSAKLRVLEKN